MSRILKLLVVKFFHYEASFDIQCIKSPLFTLNLNCTNIKPYRNNSNTEKTIHGQELNATVPDPDRTPLFLDLDRI